MALKKDQKLELFNKVIAFGKTIKEAAKEMGISYSAAKYLVKEQREEFMKQRAASVNLDDAKEKEQKDCTDQVPKEQLPIVTSTKLIEDACQAIEAANEQQKTIEQKL